jgi:hypothetical protein
VAENNKDSNREDSSKNKSFTNIRLPTQDELALVEFGKNEILHAISSITDFSKSMITLVSGFFVAYFALIKFLAGSENVQLSTLGVDPTSVGSPPVLFIISIIAFVVSYTPISPKKLASITDLLALERYRKSKLWMKRIPMVIGVAIFVIGLGITIQISLTLLF